MNLYSKNTTQSVNGGFQSYWFQGSLHSGVGINNICEILRSAEHARYAAVAIPGWCYLLDDLPMGHLQEWDVYYVNETHQLYLEYCLGLTPACN